MKCSILAVIVPALLVIGTANIAEIYNKNDNKVDLYSKAVDLYYFSKGNDENSYGGNGGMTHARLGFKGKTQINSDLTGYGRWEYNFQSNNSEGADAQTSSKMCPVLAGLKYADVGSFDYGHNYGMTYDTLGHTDMSSEFGGDTVYSDGFLVGRAGGITTYRNFNFSGLVNDLNFVVQYLGKNKRNATRRSSSDGIGGSVSYEYEGLDTVGAYGAVDRTNLQKESSLGKGKKAEQWVIGLKYDANDIYLAANYGEAHNATPITDKFTNTGGFANRTQDVLLVTQYQFDFGLCLSIVYAKFKTKDVKGIGDVGLVNYLKVGTTCYFNKNMSTYVDYIINQINSDSKLGVGSDDTVAMGIVYQF